MSARQIRAVNLSRLILHLSKLKVNLSKKAQHGRAARSIDRFDRANCRNLSKPAPTTTTPPRVWPSSSARSNKRTPLMMMAAAQQRVWYGFHYYKPNGILEYKYSRTATVASKQSFASHKNRSTLSRERRKRIQK